jgi:hypothetical protein
VSLATASRLVAQIGSDLGKAFGLVRQAEGYLLLGQSVKNRSQGQPIALAFSAVLR